jgi:hypothetical protein
MIDVAYGKLYDRVETPSEAPAAGGVAMPFVVNANWSLFQRHPWLLHAVGPRPMLGLGLTDVEMDGVRASPEQAKLFTIRRSRRGGSAQVEPAARVAASRSR